MTRTKMSSVPPGYFVYSRKSTEAEDRQVLSIASQTDEMKAVAERQQLTTVEVLSEARSAKEPGRPVFNDMMERLEAGRAQGILCWKLDRLARNPVDGGRLIWAVKQYGISIITPTQTYSREDDNMILMYIELGMAHKYVDDLSRVVKRGLEAKAKLGWFPSSAPLGYLNRVNGRTGQKEVVKDPERFALMRRMWDLMLSGGSSPDKILETANREWGFRNRSGRALPRSSLYYILTNPFYAGSFEYPLRSGRWFRGRHEPMVTEAEYDRVQALLGSKGNPRAVRRVFAYTGLIRCGYCRAMVTAEEKHQLICGTCRYKFVHRGKDRCPRCGTAVEHMLGGQTPRRAVALHYVYYHCTRRRSPKCPERAVRGERLEADLAEYLARIEVSEAFQQWVVTRLRRSHETDADAELQIRRSQEKAYTACAMRLDNLVQLKTAPENVGGSLLSDAEYARQRADLLKAKSQLEELLHQPADPVVEWSPLISEIFDFARKARTWLREEDPETKRLLLAVLDDAGSNLTLTQKKLTIAAPNPFPALAESIPAILGTKGRFEPKENGSTDAQSARLRGGFRAKLGELDDVRTYGETGIELITTLRRWLESTPTTALVGLRSKLAALFAAVDKSTVQAAGRLHAHSAGRPPPIQAVRPVSSENQTLHTSN